VTRSRTFVNLVTVVLASVVLLLFAVTQLLAQAVLDRTYLLYVELPEAGGLLENKQVTYRGVAVGTVDTVYLCGDDTAPARVPDCAAGDDGGVIVEMGVEDDARIPRGVDVVVLRQSAVGEQALDIRPRVTTGPSTAYYAEGDVIAPGSPPVLPTKPQDLLVLADRVFAPVDPESAATLVRELADAVEGRSEDVRSILTNSATFSEAIADNGADFDRLFASSRVVNASLAENREELTALLTDLADSAALLGDVRAEVDALLGTAPPVLDLTTSLLVRGDADLACVVRDLADINAYTNRPEVFRDLEESIRVNEFFFEAFRVIGPTSAQGDPWLRVHFIAEPEPPARRFVPERPVRPILPGGACESVFGPGAGAATQPGFQVVTPESVVIRPEDDRQDPRSATAVLTAAGGGAQQVGGPAVPAAVVAADAGAVALDRATPVLGTAVLALLAASALGARRLAALDLRRVPASAAPLLAELRARWRRRG
jgi:virulence factor Mce-like protein